MAVAAGGAMTIIGILILAAASAIGRASGAEFAAIYGESFVPLAQIAGVVLALVGVLVSAVGFSEN